MMHFHSLTNRFSEYMAERSLARSIDTFIHDLEQMSGDRPETVEVNNVRARVEAMVDLLEGRMEWANVDQARRLVTRVYDIRIAEEMLLAKVNVGQVGVPAANAEDPAAGVAGLLH